MPKSHTASLPQLAPFGTPGYDGVDRAPRHQEWRRRLCGQRRGARLPCRMRASFPTSRRDSRTDLAALPYSRQSFEPTVDMVCVMAHKSTHKKLLLATVFLPGGEALQLCTRPMNRRDLAIRNRLRGEAMVSGRIVGNPSGDNGSEGWLDSDPVVQRR